MIADGRPNACGGHPRENPQGDLFSVYPDRPGARPTDTSMAAADTVAEGVDNLRARVLEAIRHWSAMRVPGMRGLTADQVADLLGEDKLNVRPRCSELKRMGLIEDSGLRRPNAKGNNMIVWVARIQKEPS